MSSSARVQFKYFVRLMHVFVQPGSYGLVHSCFLLKLHLFLSSFLVDANGSVHTSISVPCTYFMWPIGMKCMSFRQLQRRVWKTKCYGQLATLETCILIPNVLAADGFYILSVLCKYNFIGKKRGQGNKGRARLGVQVLLGKVRPKRRLIQIM
jgi:hypothetical protein